MSIPILLIILSLISSSILIWKRKTYKARTGRIGLKFIIGLGLCLLISLVSVVSYLKQHQRADNLHMDHQQALLQAQAKVILDTIESRHGSLGKLKIAVLHRPGESRQGLNQELLLLSQKCHATLSFHLVSSFKDDGDGYFKGKVLQFLLKNIKADILISTCGLPAADELWDIPRFADGKPQTQDLNTAAWPALYVIGGNCQEYLPFLENASISGAVSWRAKPDTRVEGFRKLSAQQLFDQRYIFVCDDRLDTLTKEDLVMFTPPSKR